MFNFLVPTNNSFMSFFNLDNKLKTSKYPALLPFWLDVCVPALLIPGIWLPVDYLFIGVR